jgi:hypothetical protein
VEWLRVCDLLTDMVDAPPFAPRGEAVMAKVRLTLTVIREYEQRIEHYPEDQRTPEAMLAVDMVGFKDDPMLMMDSDGAKWFYKGEIID